MGGGGIPLGPLKICFDCDLEPLIARGLASGLVYACCEIVACAESHALSHAFPQVGLGGVILQMRQRVDIEAQSGMRQPIRYQYAELDLCAGIPGM